MTNSDTSVCVLDTKQGDTMVLRSGPTREEAISFIQEHTRRYFNGEPGGPSGQPALLICAARFYANEADSVDPTNAVDEIDLTTIGLPTVV